MKIDSTWTGKSGWGVVTGWGARLLFLKILFLWIKFQRERKNLLKRKKINFCIKYLVFIEWYENFVVSGSFLKYFKKDHHMTWLWLTKGFCFKRYFSKYENILWIKRFSFNQWNNCSTNQLSAHGAHCKMQMEKVVVKLFPICQRLLASMILKSISTNKKR